MTNSVVKGKRGERYVANWLKEKLGVEARRSQQYCGVAGDSDVIGLEGAHIEVKFVENLSISKAMQQAEKDAKDSNIPVIFHKKNNQPLMVTVKADDLYDLCAIIFLTAPLKSLQDTNLISQDKAKSSEPEIPQLVDGQYEQTRHQPQSLETLRSRPLKSDQSAQKSQRSVYLRRSRKDVGSQPPP